MKKRFLVKILLILLLCVSCTTVSVSESEQIVSTAITLADAQQKRGDFKSAEETYVTAYSAVKDYRLIYNLSLVQAQSGDFQKAANTSLQAYEDFPAMISFLENACKFFQADGDLDNAELIYKKILTLNPYSSDNALKLIALYEEQGLTEKAYELALEMWNKGYINNNYLQILIRYNAESWEKFTTVVN